MRVSSASGSPRRSCCAPMVMVVGVVLFFGSIGLAEGFALRQRSHWPSTGNKNRPGTPASSNVYDHWAQVQVTLDAEWTLERLKALPCAPGSRVEVLDGGARIEAEWPATVVADMIEEGGDVVVLRDFMLVQRAREGGDASAKGQVGLMGQGDGNYVAGTNGEDLPIPDYGTALSYIEIEGAESHALVTTIDVHYEISHPFSGDIWVELSDEIFSGWALLRYEEGGSADDISQTVTGIEDFAGSPVNQFWLLWVSDAYYGYTGYLDSWWIKVYYRFPRQTVANDTCEKAVVLQDGVSYQGHTLGATGDYATWSGYKDKLDVWHVFTPTQTGLVTVSVDGIDSFDTTLAVFDECGGSELGSIDDFCDELGGRMVLNMEAGADYYIRVAGYWYETGDYTVTVRQQSPEFPDEPVGPSPVDGAEAVATSNLLTWNDWVLEPALRSKLAKAAKEGGPASKLIYGRDDRVEEYEVTDADLLRAGDATVALISWDSLFDNGDGTYTVPYMTFAEYYRLSNPLYTFNPLCADEPYRDQPTVAFCSGVLVTPELVATAGHCTACTEPRDMAVVFGYVMENDLTPVVTFDADQVYRCTEVLVSQEGDPDWSLIRLDRAVTDHVPMLTRISGRAEEGQGLLLTGHPVGLPRKYENAGVIKIDTAEAFFEANLDAYQGNSGSPVFNRDSLEIEGLLVSGPAVNYEEYPDENCDRSRVCDEDEGCEGFAFERITRITAFSEMIPSYDVYLGTDPNGLELVSGYGVVPWYDPGTLLDDTTYYWRVTARNAWGQVDGPVWSFHTAEAPTWTCSPVYRFWSETYSYHFYTINETEKDNLIAKYSDVWTYDGQAFCAYADPNVTDAAPVYRFWSPSTHRHFYTISESEKNNLVNNYPQAWTYEDVAFYAYPEGAQPAETSPVYRFWSDAVHAHYYTIDEAEKDQMVAEQSDVWTFEGIAWYAYE